MESETKRCSGCGVTKHRRSFWKCSSSKDGLQQQCRACCKDRNKRYRRTGTTQRIMTCRKCLCSKPESKFPWKQKHVRRGTTCTECDTLRRAESLRAACRPERITQRVPVTFEYEPGTSGWNRLEDEASRRTEDAFARLRANREEVLNQ